MDTRPRTLAAVAALMAFVLTGMVAVVLNLASNTGPGTPALFNNSLLPARLVVDGAPAAPVPPGGTVRVAPGTTWVMPDRVTCTWHPGTAGGPRMVSSVPGVASASSVPVDQFVTVEGCIEENR